MATYLLVWNPKRMEWKALPSEASQVKDGKPHRMRWSCGVTKRIQRGDRVFLIRLGDEPRGIFGSGTVVKGSYKGKHWMEEKAKLGKKAWYIKGEFETLLDPKKDKILLRKQLDKAPLAGVNWSTQSSGITIPDEIAVKLEEVWAKIINTKNVAFLSSNQLILEAEIIASDSFDFQKQTRKITSTLQRVIRDSATGKILKSLYEYNCQVCGCTIETPSGKRYAECIISAQLANLTAVGW
jgi:5-methylcytosine-specific restriction protein A